MVGVLPVFVNEPSVYQCEAMDRKVYATIESLLAGEHQGMVAIRRIRTLYRRSRSVSIFEQHIGYHDVETALFRLAHSLFKQISIYPVVLRHIEEIFSLRPFLHHRQIAGCIPLAVVML